jgi:hypothetical protein
MGARENDAAPPPERANSALWRQIRRQANEIARRGRGPTDRELDDFTRLVQRLPAPRADRSGS